MTQFLAGILAGVFISLINQVAVSLFTKPILDIRELVGQIAASLIYHANVYGPLMREERKVEAQAAFRGQACMLRAKANALIFPCAWSTIRLVPNRSNLVEAFQEPYCSFGICS